MRLVEEAINEQHFSIITTNHREYVDYTVIQVTFDNEVLNARRTNLDRRTRSKEKHHLYGFTCAIDGRCVYIVRAVSSYLSLKRNVINQVIDYSFAEDV